MSDPAAIVSRVFGRANQIGLSDGEMTRLSGLAGDRLTAIQAGSVPSAYEYERLCRAVAVDPSALYRSEDSAPGRTPVRYRAAFSIDRPTAADVRRLALAAEEGRILGQLLRLLGRDVPLESHRRVQAVSRRRETWQEGYDLAEQARRLLRVPDGPVLDLERLLRELGVHVARVRFSSRDLDAASVWERGAVAVIVLNNASPRVEHPGARRSTLAHELCHLLHDAGARDCLTTSVSWGAESVGNYSELAEVRARAFAPAFLAPRTQVVAWRDALPRRVRNKDSEVVKALAEEWGFSFEGAAWHAKNCQIISAQKAEELASQRRKPTISYERFETSQAGAPPAMVDASLPNQPAELWDGWATEIVLSAMDEGCISVGRARELLSWA